MNIKQQLVEEISKAINNLEIPEFVPKVEYPKNSVRGDYSSNVAMIAYGNLAKAIDSNVPGGKKPGVIYAKSKDKMWHDPEELAEDIKKELEINNSMVFEKIEVVKPGFINFWISNDILLSSLTALDKEEKPQTSLSGKKIMVEFAHPNTHKAFHIGHLRNIATGESIVRLLEATGATVIRANYQGDVGMHIAKCLYGILQNSKFTHSAGSGQEIQNSKLNLNQKIDLLGKAYAAGSKVYEEDENAKKEIGLINKKIYARDESIWELYQTTRQWSLDYFEQIYKRVYSYFDKYYFESEVFDLGKENILKGLEKGIFEKSDGAIIFPGKKYGLHDRVFITSEGNPTYEGKEMGLGPLQFKENNPDLIIHVVGPEQSGYFQVVFEALAQLFPQTRGKEQHLAYGWVKLKHGKMNSRSGNVILGDWLIDEAKKEIFTVLEKSDAGYTGKEKEDIAEKVAIAAVKYSFLKVTTQQEIAFDLEESISFDGNSGPYIQYVYARTQSVIGKWQMANGKWQKENHKLSAISHKLEAEERSLLRLLTKFDEVVVEAAERLSPSAIATYLFELAQTFNLFYQKHQILKAEGESRNFRLALTSKTGEVIKKGLSLLGIEAPSKM